MSEEYPGYTLVLAHVLHRVDRDDVELRFHMHRVGLPGRLGYPQIADALNGIHAAYLCLEDDEACAILEAIACARIFGVDDEHRAIMQIPEPHRPRLTWSFMTGRDGSKYIVTDHVARLMTKEQWRALVDGEMDRYAS